MDLVTSINLKPLLVFKRLEVGKTNPTSVTLQMENVSIKRSWDVVEGVLVKVEKFIFLVYFIVLEIKEDHDIPIILCHQFLATERALIDV